jgi:signal transduction histidine kinase
LFDFNFKINNDSVDARIGFNPILNTSNVIEFVIVTITNTTFENLITKENEQSRYVSITKENLNRFSDSLVSLVHEISQPLLALNLKIDLITKKYANTDKQLSKEIDELKNYSQRITDVVDLARSYSQSAETNDFKQLVLNDILETISKNLNYEFQKNNVKVHLSIPNEDIYCLAKTDLLIDSFTKVLNNILSYNEFDSQKELKIKLTKENSNIASIIFDNNFMNEDSNFYDNCFNFTNTNKGSGSISFPLAKEIIEGFGGTITARKKPQGSIFSINLPQYVSNERQQLLNLMDIHNSSD